LESQAFFFTCIKIKELIRCHLNYFPKKEVNYSVHASCATRSDFDMKPATTFCEGNELKAARHFWCPSHKLDVKACKCKQMWHTPHYSLGICGPNKLKEINRK